MGCPLYPQNPVGRWLCEDSLAMFVIALTPFMFNLFHHAVIDGHYHSACIFSDGNGRKCMVSDKTGQKSIKKRERALQSEETRTRTLFVNRIVSVRLDRK